jgi:hypothetical protein
MGAPVAITNPDFGVRTITAYDLEVALVKFLKQIFDSARLDNPRVNVFQATQPEHPIVKSPDDPPVSYDPTQRAQTLFAKVPPQITRGRVPRTVTGEIDLQQLPNVPSIIIQAISGRVETNSTIVEAKICVAAYDENPNGQGYQDVLNMIETATFALAAWGQKGIDDAYVIVLPMDWKLEQADTFPHFAGEIATKWELPTASPLPGPGELNIPGEVLDFKIEYPGSTNPPEPPPYVPPPGPSAPSLIYSWPVENQDDKGFSYGVMGNDSLTMAMGGAFQALALQQGGKLSSVKLWVRAQTGNFDCLVNVYAASGAPGLVLPTGPILATSEVIPAAVLSVDRIDGAMQEFVFDGANQIDLVAGQVYAFVFTYAGTVAPPNGEFTYVGLNWVPTLPNNVGYIQNGWNNDDYGTLTFYLYAT